MTRQYNSKRWTRLRVLVATFVSLLVVSLLPAGCRQTKIHARATEVDSKNLKQTVVVATLECPLPEHKNAIWCSTFQMAWDRFKQDIIGEPIRIPEVQELADRLNRSQFPTGSVEEKSYYAVAGFVAKGIIEQVQRDMAKRFPSEPVPVFDKRYRTLPDVVLAYAFLNVDVGFLHPYYTYLRGFVFSDANGTQTSVTAFCAQASGRGKDREQVREQAEVLYYDDSQSPGAEQFAVDLSRQTQPYQVVLTRMPRGNTLGEAAKTLQAKIAAFKNDPHYETLRKLQLGDTLVVPDVLYKLAHHFDELLGKHFANQKWRDDYFFEALQRIDFTLSRTGVVVKSEARLAKTTSAQPTGPRHLHFDRPFLICVQKREPNATPFFLMWVDNAELMKPYANKDKEG